MINVSIFYSGRVTVLIQRWNVLKNLYAFIHNTVSVELRKYQNIYYLMMQYFSHLVRVQYTLLCKNKLI